MTAQNSISLDPLPPGVTIEKIYVDFFTYVCQHTQKFFEEREVQGRSIWQRLKGENRIEFVIAHPNGWTLLEQVFLRKVALKSASGFVSKDPTSFTVHLVAEAEASVHFMILHGGLEKSLQVSLCISNMSSLQLLSAWQEFYCLRCWWLYSGHNVVQCEYELVASCRVVSTLCSSYQVAKARPRLDLGEIRASACTSPPFLLYLVSEVPPGIQAGGIFVNKNAEIFFTAKFLRARCDVSDARIATEEFEKEKKRFSNEHVGLKLRVGNSRMNIPSINLKRGYLELTGWAVDFCCCCCI
jgi:hypothetical protein